MLERIEEQRIRVERIKQIMQEYNLNASQFAERIDVTQSNLSAMLNGNRAIGEGIINKICLSFDNINKSWLLGSEIASMLKSTSTAIAQGRSVSVVGDGNISNTGTISESSMSYGDDVNNLKKRILKLEEENEQLKKDKAILQEFITFLQNKK